MTYQSAFERHIGLDPFTATMRELLGACDSRGFASRAAVATRDECLDYLLAEAVQPALGNGRVYLLDFPVSQSALARVRAGHPDVAERFELYIDGVEIANGYHELRDAAELRGRMRRDIDIRHRAGRSGPALDERLLAAHEFGLPHCAGVAVGFDRLVMLAGRFQSLADVLAFPDGAA